MALTMTRTRTQTALNKLAFNLAEVNGELAFLAGLGLLTEEQEAAAARRRAELQGLQEALCVVIRRYDPELDPDRIGESFEWMKAYGRKPTAKTVRRYFAAIQGCETDS
jgi:outer membrane PBP1 activator LpoA protein